MRPADTDWCSLIEHVSDFVVLVDRAGTILYANRAPEGCTAGRAIGTSVFDSTLAQHREELRRALEHVFETGRPDALESRAIGPHGAPAWYANRLAAARRDGRVNAVAIIATDITRRKQTEEELRASDEHLRLLAENAHDIIFRYRLTEPRGHEYISPAVTRIAGYMPEQYYADPDFGLKVVHPADREALEEMVRELRTDPVELRWVCKDGSVIWTEQRNVLIRDDGGNVVAIEGIARDVTQRKRIEEALQRAREELEGRVEQQLRQRNPYGLTFREFTVLHLVADGKADKAIARELGISSLTVHKHVSSILARMNASSRTEAGVRALREGLLA